MRFLPLPVAAVVFFLSLACAAPALPQEVKTQPSSGAAEAASKSSGEKPSSEKDDSKSGDSSRSRRSGESEGKSSGGDHKSGEHKADHKNEEPSGITQRPLKPLAPPNPQELKARPASDGKIRFNFRGQPWPDVLNWLAEVSGMSFDWQELPGDYLNLVTQRGYSIEEARDLINRHLLARGFTMLENDELLTVVNVKKLDAGMVPRVEPQDLVKRRPHEFVKVSFPLDWIVAESAVEELKPMLSPNGKLASLKSTNRIEAMDAVINLREIYKVIGQEQSDIGQEKLVREFDLQYTKAVEVHQQLQKLLGVEEKQTSAVSGRSMSQEQIQQMMQQQQQEMMQQMRKGGGANLSAQKPEINLVVNVRRNSVLARANPDKMAVIAQAIKMLDVPSEHSQTIQGNLSRMQVYRLAGLDPLALVKTLEDSGGLDPNTRLQVDEKNKAVIVQGSLADHMMIRQVIEKLDGSGRSFEVITLRKLEADFVAGTIEFMFNGGAEEKQQQRRPYDYGDYYRRSSERQETSTDKFRVDADVENNRLLLWANEVELQEVRNLMVKLGEIPDRRAGGGNQSRVRVLSVPAGREAEELLERLRRAWPSVAPNPLIAPEAHAPAPTPTETPAKAPAETVPAEQPASKVSDRKSQSAARETGKKWQPFVRLAQLSGDDAPVQNEAKTPKEFANPADPAARFPAKTNAASTPPPVKIEVGPDGRLVVSSQDTQALDLIEELAEELAPERRDYVVFQLKHAPSYWIKLNLVEFFEEEDKSKKDTRSRYYYIYEQPQDKKDSRQRLSKRKALKFISDSDTNTIVVIGADASQLRTIKELIDLYDRPEPTDSSSARMTTVVPIRWSKAQTIADAVKDVYRDLLSANDKSLVQQGQNGEQKGRPQSQNTYIFGGDTDKKDERTPVTFKGKLSLGIDEVSNTLLVSAEGENLLNNVLKMVESLDQAARPSSTVQVLKIGGGVNSSEVKKVLTGLLTDQATQAPNGRDANGNGNGRQPGQRGNGQRHAQQQGDSSRSSND